AWRLRLMFPQARWLNPAGWSHLLVYGVWLPAMVAWNARKIAARVKRMPPRLAYFRSQSLGLLILATLSVLVARVQHLGLFSLSVPHLGRGLIAGALMYPAAVVFMWPRWRRAVVCRARAVHYFMHDNAMELAWWLGVSVLGGVGEEISWR